jgi:hypothetical protein
VGDGEGATTFTEPQIQRAKAIRCGIVAAIAIFLLYQMAGSTETSLVRLYMALVAAFALVMLLGTVRSFRSGIFLDDGGVTVRGSFSTRRWRWDELRAAGIQDRSHTQRAPAGFTLQPGKPDTRVVILPTLLLTSGKTVFLYTVRVTLPEPDSSNWVDEAVREINRRLETRRAQGDAAATPP